jgi:hypothetical protein
MRQIFGTAICGVIAFAAITVGVERSSDACNTIPPENDCAVTHDGTTVYYARRLQTVQTSASPSQNCGCGQALGNLPAGASVVSAGVYDLNGNATAAFCGGGTNAQTTAAFQNALGGVTWSNAVLNAVSTAGVLGGQAGYGIWKVTTSDGAFDGVAGVAQVNFGPGGSVTVDPQHQAVANINATQCTDCSVNPGARACIAIQRVRSQPDASLYAIKVACARTDAVDLLGLPPDGNLEVESEGGCTAARGAGPAAMLLLGLVGVGLAIGRARRRA